MIDLEQLKTGVESNTDVIVDSYTLTPIQCKRLLNLYNKLSEPQRQIFVNQSPFWLLSYISRNGWDEVFSK